MDARTMIEGCGFLAAGLLAGWLYFLLLHWNTSLYLAGDRVAGGIALHVVRLGALAGMLVVTAIHGAAPLLLFALGLLIARPLVMRRIAAS
jgi:hypothetical protein